MDTFLCHGDHQRNGRGFLRQVDGAQEVCQRAMIRLSVPKGSFGLDRELGSRLHLLGRSAPEQLEELALEYAREALLDESQIRVLSAKRKVDTGDMLELEFELEYSGDEVTEVFKVMWEFDF